MVEIERYFDLSLLHNTGEEESVLCSGGVAQNSIVSIGEITTNDFDLAPDMVARIKNTSPNPATLGFYPANSATAAPGEGTQYILLQGQSIEKTLGELGMGVFAFFNVQNTSANDGTWEIEVFL